MRTLTCTAATMVTLLPLHASMADTITLLHSVRMESRAATILLRDIAEFDGPEALAFADLEVGAISSDRVLELSLADIRRKLEDAGAHWGKLNLNGGRSVTIRPGRAPTAEPPMAMAPIQIAPAEASPNVEAGCDEQIASNLLNEATVRGAIANLVVCQLQIDPSNVQLGFDRGDSDLLGQASTAGRFELHPLGSLESDRIEMTIRLWDEGKVQSSSTITINPMLRVRAATLRHDVQRDQMIAETDVTQEDHWLPPSQAQQVVDRVTAIGRVATRRMKAGEIVRERAIRRDVIVKYGDPVLVRCLVGGAVISLQAEARTDGGHGDIIELRKQGERQTFQATITGRGEAVLDLTRRRQGLST